MGQLDSLLYFVGDSQRHFSTSARTDRLSAGCLSPGPGLPTGAHHMHPHRHHHSRPGGRHQHHGPGSGNERSRAGMSGAFLGELAGKETLKPSILNR